MSDDKQEQLDVDLSTIMDLRNHALRTIMRLERGEIDVNEVGVVGKLYESVISSVKTEIQYAKMLNLKPKIAFIENSATYDGVLIPGLEMLPTLPALEGKSEQ